MMKQRANLFSLHVFILFSTSILLLDYLKWLVSVWGVSILPSSSNYSRKPSSRASVSWVHWWKMVHIQFLPLPGKWAATETWDHLWTFHLHVCLCVMCQGCRFAVHGKLLARAISCWLPTFHSKGWHITVHFKCLYLMLRERGTMKWRISLFQGPL